MILYATVVVCAALAARLVYRYDLYEREPWWMVVGVGLLGVATMWVAGRLEEWTLGAGTPSVLAVAAVAATHEEALRVLAIGVLAVVLPAQVNDPFDGVIYGSILGLGMAVQESVDRMLFLPPPGAMLPGAELVRLLGHLVLGGIACAGIGFARGGVPRWPAWLAGGIVFATVWHFLWDWLAFAGAAWDRMTWWGSVGAVALMLTGLAAYAALVVIASRHSRDRYAPGDGRRVWGWPFTRTGGLLVPGGARLRRSAVLAAVNPRFLLYRLALEGQAPFRPHARIGRVKFDPGNGAMGALMRTQRYQPEIAYVLRERLRKGDVFIDVGASVGYFSAMALGLVGPTGAVLAFEPHPRRLPDLARLRRDNPDLPLHIFDLALGDRPGTALLHMSDGPNIGWATMVEGFMNPGEPKSAAAVRVARLDDLPVSRALHVRLMKVDAEGSDLQVLQGSRMTIARCQPWIVIEYSARAMRHLGVTANDWREVLHELRYEVRDLRTRRQVALPPGSDLVDLLLVPES